MKKGSVELYFIFAIHRQSITESALSRHNSSFRAWLSGGRGPSYRYGRTTPMARS
jgi:hypothetical protein